MALGVLLLLSLHFSMHSLNWDPTSVQPQRLPCTLAYPLSLALKLLPLTPQPWPLLRRLPGTSDIWLPASPSSSGKIVRCIFRTSYLLPQSKNGFHIRKTTAQYYTRSPWPHLWHALGHVNMGHMNPGPVWGICVPAWGCTGVPCIPVKVVP